MAQIEPQSPPTTPFKDVINLQLSKVYQDTEETLAKEVPLTQTASSYDI